MTQLVAVQMIFKPEPRISCHRLLLKVHHQHPMPLCLGSDDAVELGGPITPMPAKWVDRCGIRMVKVSTVMP
jgi:hypothetical protein